VEEGFIDPGGLSNDLQRAPAMPLWANSARAEERILCSVVWSGFAGCFFLLCGILLIHLV